MAKKIVKNSAVDTVDKNVTSNADGAEPVVGTVDKKARRAIGTGSVWKMANGKYGWCVQLTADKSLKEKYKNKLRVLGCKNTYEEASEAALDAIKNRDILLKQKLEKLGHVYESADTASVDETPKIEA